MKNTFIPPKAAIRPHEMTVHGHTRIDNYYWLNERENPEVIAYLEAENQYAEACQQLKTQIAATDGEIDRRVYELYGLTEEEISIVEGMN